MFPLIVSSLHILDVVLRHALKFSLLLLEESDAVVTVLTQQHGILLYLKDALALLATSCPFVKEQSFDVATYVAGIGSDFAAVYLEELLDTMLAESLLKVVVGKGCEL